MPAAMDRETASRTDDHQALRLWLRLLTCSQLIEREVRARLQQRFDTTFPRESSATCAQRQARNKHRFGDGAIQQRFGTTLPRFDLMSQLWRYPAGLKMNELSRHLMVTGGNVTGIVDLLEKDGLVERTPEPADRRAYRVRLTRAGRKAFAEMARAHEGWIVDAFRELTGREMATMAALLARLKTHVRSLEERDA